MGHIAAYIYRIYMLSDAYRDAHAREGLTPRREREREREREHFILIDFQSRTDIYVSAITEYQFNHIHIKFELRE